MKMTPSQRLLKRLNAAVPRLEKVQTLPELRRELKRALGYVAQVRCLQEDTLDSIVVHGTYDNTETDTTPIEVLIQGPEDVAGFDAQQLVWQVWQTVQHEQVHEVQYMQRPHDHAERSLRWRQAGAQGETQQRNRDYLACLDEIDAFANDLALEVQHLGQGDWDTWNTHPTWQRYADTFAGCEWTEIRQRLLKRAWLHLQAQ